MTLEYVIYNLGVKKVDVPKYADWFQRESSTIHQEMYELGKRGFAIGGSEERVI